MTGRRLVHQCQTSPFEYDCLSRMYLKCCASYDANVVLLVFQVGKDPDPNNPYDVQDLDEYDPTPMSPAVQQRAQAVWVEMVKDVSTLNNFRFTCILNRCMSDCLLFPPSPRSSSCVFRLRALQTGSSHSWARMRRLAEFTFCPRFLSRCTRRPTSSRLTSYCTSPAASSKCPVLTRSVVGACFMHDLMLCPGQARG